MFKKKYWISSMVVILGLPALSLGDTSTSSFANVIANLTASDCPNLEVYQQSVEVEDRGLLALEKSMGAELSKLNPGQPADRAKAQQIANLTRQITQEIAINIANIMKFELLCENGGVSNSEGKDGSSVPSAVSTESRSESAGHGLQ